MSNTTSNGKICYIEMPSGNIDESAKFYKEVFGWSIRQRKDGSTSFDDGVSQVSGVWLNDRQPETNPNMVVFIMVDNAKNTIDLITKYGGSIVQEIGAHLPEITALFSDRTGNVLGIYQEPAQ